MHRKKSAKTLKKTKTSKKKSSKKTKKITKKLSRPIVPLTKEARENEQEITKTVKTVRETDNGQAFLILQSYLSYYIKLFGKKYKIPGCDSDEIEQECLFALRYKAIEDFDPSRGKFKSFAILCIKRHLFSLIKGNNQLKRQPLNKSLSLNEDRSDEGESLSLANLITEDRLTAEDEFSKNENFSVRQEKLLSKLSKLEQEVLKLYLQQLHYDEIVSELKKIFPKKRLSKKTVDNSLQRLRSKAQQLSKTMDFNED